MSSLDYNVEMNTLYVHNISIRVRHMIKACCGFGHREVFHNISAEVYNAVLDAAEHGCTVFYTGAMGEFDMIFSSAVRQAKLQKPLIKLICVQPYLTQKIIEDREYIYSLYDDIIVPTELADIHPKAVIAKRNQWMIRHSDLVLVYTIRDCGGAYNAMRYAERQNKQVIRLHGI